MHRDASNPDSAQWAGSGIERLPGIFETGIPPMQPARTDPGLTAATDPTARRRRRRGLLLVGSSALFAAPLALIEPAAH